MAKRLHAGKFRHRVTIKEKSVTRNTYGEETVTWVEIGTYWGSVEPIRGREFVEMRQAQAEITTRIRIRYISGITPAMKAFYDSREYDIMDVIHVEERQREIQLMCRERVTYI